jgi:hypothetical protein
MTMPGSIQLEKPRREDSPYSLDLAPSDFYLFGPLQVRLDGICFADDKEVETEVRKGLRQQSKDVL